MAFINQNGGRVIFHNCGCAKNLMPRYSGLGMAMYESLTPAPLGDSLLSSAVDTLGKETMLSGSIDQVEFLMSASLDQLGQAVRQTLDVAKGRCRFIMAATDYFHEDTPHENLQAVAVAFREC